MLWSILRILGGSQEAQIRSATLGLIHRSPLQRLHPDEGSVHPPGWEGKCLCSSEGQGAWVRKERKKEEEGALLGGTCAWPRVGGEYDTLRVWCPSTTGRTVTLPILPPTLQIPVKPLTPRAQRQTKVHESHRHTIFISQRPYLKGCSKSELSGQWGLSQEVPQAGPQQLSLTVTVILPLLSRGLPSLRGH